MINQNYILILYLDDAHQQQDIIFGYIMAQQVKNLPTMQETQETQVQSLGWEDPLEEEMASHSNISCLENSMDRGAWRGIVQRIGKNWT